MTELVVDEARYACVVPRTLRDVAVLVEPLTIAEKAIAQLTQIQQRLPWACPTNGKPRQTVIARSYPAPGPPACSRR